MQPETTLSKIEATLNYLQTFTRESIFQYGMNYEVNFQIKNEMTCHDSISRAARRHTREYTVAPPDNTEQGTAFTSLFIKNTR